MTDCAEISAGIFLLIRQISGLIVNRLPPRVTQRPHSSQEHCSNIAAVCNVDESILVPSKAEVRRGDTYKNFA